MKKLFALIVALVMALSCTLALAEESAAFPGITVYAELDVDREAASQYLEMFGFTDDALATANGVVAMLDALNEKTIITSDGIQYELGLNDANMLSLGGSLTDEGIVVVSSLFPNYALTVSMETISNLVKTAMSNLRFSSEDGGLPFDVNALTEAVSGYIDPFVESVTGAVTIGETEVGEFEYEGHKFNAKTAVDVDTKAITEAVNTLLDQLNKDETVQSALQAMQGAGVKVDIPEEGIDLESETAPNVEVTIYTYVDDEGNASDEVYVLVTVTPAEDPDGATIVHTLVEGDKLNVTVEVPAENATVKFARENTENGTRARFIADINGMYFAVGMTTEITDSIAVNVDLYFLSDVKPLATANLDVTMSGELTMDVTGEGKTVVAVEDLMNSDESTSDVVSGLMMDLLLNGLGGTMNAISENVPELSESLGNIMGSLMGA